MEAIRSTSSRKSRKNRTKSSFELPRYITATMGFLEKISPFLATRFALRLFYTPLNFKRPRREMRCYENASKHKLHTAKSAFIAFEWGNPKGEKVLLVHGWSGRATQFFRLIDALVEKNFHVFSFDAPAHGGSPKKRTHLLEFIESIDVIQSKFGEINNFIGHSLGGMAIFNTLKANVERKKIITIGTPNNIGSIVLDFCRKVNASEKIADHIIEHIEKKHDMKISKASTDELAFRFNPHGLIVHDEDDLDVDVLNARTLARNWPNASLVITKGLGHRKVLMDQKIIESIVGFLPLS